MLDRKIAPPFRKSVSFELPGYQTSVVNGIPLFFIPEVHQNVMKIELLLPAGKWFEPKHGISHFTSNMIEKGTTRLDSSELAEAFDRLGAHIEISAGYDHTSVSVYALLKNWKEAIKLLAEMVINPAFEQEELDLMREIFLQNLKVNKEKTSFVAGQLIRRNIFGSHPYGTSLEEKDVLSVTTKDLVAFHESTFKPSSIFITAPTSVSKDEVASLLTSLTFSADDSKDDRAITPGKKNEHIEKEGVQTSIRMGRQSLHRTHADYPDLLLFTHILGGYFGSRLMKNIREEKGLTYGIYASINPFKHDSFFVIGADVNKENKELALQEIAKEIKTMRTQAVDAEELEIAKNHFLGSLQSEVANPFSVTDKIKNIHVNELPSDYYPKLFKRIDSLSAEDLMKVGEKWLNEETMFVATVG